MNLDVFGKSSKYNPPPYYPVPPTMKNVIWKSRIALVTYYTWGKEYIAGFKQHDEWLGPYHVEYTPSRPIWEVKQRRAWLVLAWVTGWEYHVFKPSFSLPHSPCKHTLKFYCKNRHFSHVLWLPSECQPFTKIEIRVSKILESGLTGKHHTYVRDWLENTTRMSVTDGNRMRQRCPSAMATPQHEPTSCQIDVVSSRQVSML